MPGIPMSIISLPLTFKFFPPPGWHHYPHCSESKATPPSREGAKTEPSSL